MRPGTINSGREFKFLWRYPEELLARLEPGLIVDVGAASGGTVEVARRASPGSRVIAFEPFAGNLPYLNKAVGSDPCVSVRPVALADYQGTGTLAVPSIVTGDSGRWAEVAGSSRTGKLNPFPFRRAAAKGRVPVTTLDDEVQEHVRFLKIDVQAGEFNVLNGARQLIGRHGVDLIYVEFRGDLRLLRLLDRSGYVLLDGIYMAWPHRRYFPNWFRRRKEWKIPDWDVRRTATVSNGHRARYVWPEIPSRSFAAYCAWFYWQRIFCTGLQTDLLCVHSSFQDQFSQAVSANASQRVRD